MSIDKQYVDYNYDYGKDGNRRASKKGKPDVGDILKQIEAQNKEFAELANK